ncbi:ATP-grasp domain-containing protein [Neolewinella aurantiaca]|nr:glutathione synthetase [Neolewinella aurantiaca]
MIFLILTDHSGHSNQNSLYALTRTLVADARTSGVFVASRADVRNSDFFAGNLSKWVFGLNASTDFDFDPTGEQFTASPVSMPYAEADVVWLRIPPPADSAFFAALTSYAPAAEPTKKPVVINNPEGILETGSKDFLYHFSDYTAPVRRVQSADDVIEFADLHPIVLKPLREYGGRGLVKIAHGVVDGDGLETTLDRWLETAKPDLEAGHYLAMKYLKNVDQGDKRILVVNGKILGASLRLPAPGQWLCNVARGGTSIIADVAPEEEVMIAAVAPTLLEKGIVIFGADTLMNDDGKRVLSELNTNSIGGFPQAEAQTGRPILQQTINGIYDYLADRI